MRLTRTTTEIICLLFFCGLFVYLPSAARAENYYVNSVTGNDTGNDGSQAAPWKTITHAVNRASGLDSLYIAPGSYIESIDLRPRPKRALRLLGQGTGGNMPVIQTPNPDSHTIETFDFSGTLQNLAVTGQQMPMESISRVRKKRP